MLIPNGVGPSGVVTRSPAPAGGRSLRSACGGWYPPTARAHQMGGRGVPPMRRSLPKECLRGKSSPQRRRPIGWGGHGVRHRCLRAAYGGDSNLQRRGPISCGDGESYGSSGRCPRGSSGDINPPMARPLARGEGGRAQVVVTTQRAPTGDGTPSSLGPPGRVTASPIEVVVAT